MAVPKFFEFYLPMLQFLADEKPHSSKEINLELARRFSLTQQELNEMLPSARQTTFSNRTGWARTYLKKAGLIDNISRGVFCITPNGKKALAECPGGMDNSYLMRYPSFLEFCSAKTGCDEDEADFRQSDGQTPDDILEEAFEQINRNLEDELLEQMLRLPPAALEKMVLNLMGRMGYGTFAGAGMTTSAAGDEGIDGIIMQDKLGFDLIYVQVKRWERGHVVGRPDIQAFVGAIAGKGGKGLFVTTSSFSRQAVEYAKTQHIVLMDGRRLAQCMAEHHFGVSIRRVFEIKAVDSDFFEEYLEL